MGKISSLLALLGSAVVSVLLLKNRKEEKKTYEFHNTDKFTYEMMFNWFRQNADMTDENISCILSKGKAAIKILQAARQDVKKLMTNEGLTDENIVLAVVNKTTGDVIKYSLINSKSIDDDVKSLLTEKELIIIE